MLSSGSKARSRGRNQGISTTPSQPGTKTWQGIGCIEITQ